MPGSESVTDIIKKTYAKLEILKNGPTDGEGKELTDKKGRVVKDKGKDVKVWAYAGLKKQGLHTILKLPYIDARAVKEKADYFFNYKDESLPDQNAIEKSINNLRESLLKGTLPTPELIEKKIEKIIEYAIKGVSGLDDSGRLGLEEGHLESLEKIIKDLFGNSIEFMKEYDREKVAVRGGRGQFTQKKFQYHYELKVFTLSFLYLIRTSYYVQIILFHLRNLFLSKARKQNEENLDWMADGKLKNMVIEPDERGVTAENNYIRESGGFKDIQMVIPERKGELPRDGDVIRKKGLELLFDNIINGGTSKDDPIMVVMGLLNSESELDKYSETIKYLNQINSIDMTCIDDNIKESFSQISFNKNKNIKISTGTKESTGTNDDGTLENEYITNYVKVTRPDAAPEAAAAEARKPAAMAAPEAMAAALGLEPGPAKKIPASTEPNPSRLPSLRSRAVKAARRFVASAENVTGIDFDGDGEVGNPQGGGTLKRRKPKKKGSRKKNYKVARKASRKLIKKKKFTRTKY